MRSLSIRSNVYSISLFLLFWLLHSFGDSLTSHHSKKTYFKPVNPIELTPYQQLYFERLTALGDSVNHLLNLLEDKDISNYSNLESSLKAARKTLKAGDFFWRYIDPIQYRKLNGVLPVEWEVEVFEKWEAPYRREGGGFFLLEEQLGETHRDPDPMKLLLRKSKEAILAFRQDSNTRQLSDPGHFYFANRLFLLNLAVIYTSGFENPDTAQILPELLSMLHKTRDIYAAFALSHPAYLLPADYTNLFYRMIFFINSSQGVYSNFDHFTFIKDYVNPLYRLNAKRILELNLRSKSFNDYALNNQAPDIFSKNLYRAQENFFLFKRAAATTKAELIKLGELLFHDPLLSGNNLRSCASCHKPGQFFTDTATRTALTFDQQGLLARNAPTLLNAASNHLMMYDGLHLSLKDQLKAVHLNVEEMKGDVVTTMKELLSCSVYKNKLEALAAQSTEKKLSFDHVAEAIIAYYTRFDTSVSGFDKAIRGQTEISKTVKKGFNLFMGKAACGTCHFAPHFNGIKPPYTGNEFEVLGVPVDTQFTSLSPDPGRFGVHPVPEMRNAFRTGALRNIARTKPYMHNGIYNSLLEVIEFYNKGGAKGRGLSLDNQTLPEDHLNLTDSEKIQLLRFLESLNEDVSIQSTLPALPGCKTKELNQRAVGGVY
ncbi:MAG: cytochrome C peroxidase [Saprospiraceae bacterium]|nr:cytochrome C peroxidase [Saprospiraceae bacterium]